MAIQYFLTTRYNGRPLSTRQQHRVIHNTSQMTSRQRDDTYSTVQVHNSTLLEARHYHPARKRNVQKYYFYQHKYIMYQTGS